MSEACLYNILALPQSDLRRVLPKASTRTLAKLVSAYPRAIGRTFLEVLGQCTNTVTVEFIKDEINNMRVPSYNEIRQAESELMKIVHEENLEAQSSDGSLSTPAPR
jgi:hypothetical protein